MYDVMAHVYKVILVYIYAEVSYIKLGYKYGEIEPLAIRGMIMRYFDIF